MLTFSAVDTGVDLASLAQWLSSEEWPFHANRHLTAQQVLRFVEEGLFDPPNNEAYWISTAHASRVGLLRLTDLDDVDDGAPRFDLRICRRFQGQHIGTEVVRWMAEQLFTRFTSLLRVEATTRDDNLAMQRVLERCGFVQEGRLRLAWPSSDGTVHDTLLYAILRRDWFARVHACQ